MTQELNALLLRVDAHCPKDLSLELADAVGALAGRVARLEALRDSLNDFLAATSAALGARGRGADAPALYAGVGAMLLELDRLAREAA